jgi:hypothetical protein
MGIRTVQKTGKQKTSGQRDAAGQGKRKRTSRQMKWNRRAGEEMGDSAQGGRCCLCKYPQASPLPHTWARRERSSSVPLPPLPSPLHECSQLYSTTAQSCTWVGVHQRKRRAPPPARETPLGCSLLQFKIRTAQFCTWVGVGQQAADGQQDLGDGQSWRPANQATEGGGCHSIRGAVTGGLTRAVENGDSHSIRGAGAGELTRAVEGGC